MYSWLFIKALGKYWWALMSCAAFTLLGIYVAATRATSDWVVKASVATAGVMFVVAAYLAWRDERRSFERASSELTSERLLNTRGPELWLTFQHSHLFTGFVVTNRSVEIDAAKVSLDRVETNSWILDTKTIDLVEKGQGRSALASSTTRKGTGEQNISPDFYGFFKDAIGVEWETSIKLILRCRDVRGRQFIREIIARVHHLELEGDDWPELTHGEVRPL